MIQTAKSRIRYLLIIFMLLFCANAYPAKIKDPYITCLDLLEQKQYTAAYKIALKLRKSRDRDQQVLGSALLAKVYRKKQLFKKAEEILLPYSVRPRKFKDDMTTTCYLEYVQLCIAKRDFPAALKHLDYLGKNLRGWVRIECYEAMGDVYRELKEYQKSYNFYSYALSEAKGYISQSDSEKQGYLASLRRKLAELKRLLDIERYGLGFVLYREAEVLRKKGEFDKALQKYDHIEREEEIAQIYKEAAGLYRSYCFVGQRQPDKALKELLSFYEKLPDGLYRGEALALIASICLKEKVVFDKAQKWYDKAFQWGKTIRSRDKIIAEITVPNKAVEVTKPPKEEYTRDNWQNLLKTEVTPGKLFNRKNCQWYLPNLMKTVLFRLGAIAIIQGNSTKAKEYFCQIGIFDPVVADERSGGRPNVQSRLMAIADRGYPFSDLQELSVFAKKEGLEVLLADFHYACEEFSQAKDMYLKISKRPSLNRNQKAHIMFCLGNAENMLHNQEAAYKYLSLFLTDTYKGTKIYPRALYCLSHLCVINMRKGEKYEKNWEKGFRILTSTGYASTKLGEKALFHYGFVLETRDESKARELYKKAIRLHPKTVYRQIMEDFING